MASPGDSSHPEQGRAGPGTDGLPSCGGSGLFLSRWAHPGRVFPSNNALFLHPAISAEECAVCVSSRKPKTSIMVSCPAASSSHSFIEVSPGLYLSTDDMLNLEGTGWGGGPGPLWGRLGHHPHRPGRRVARASWPFCSPCPTPGCPAAPVHGSPGPSAAGEVAQAGPRLSPPAPAASALPRCATLEPGSHTRAAAGRLGSGAGSRTKPWPGRLPSGFLKRALFSCVMTASSPKWESRSLSRSLRYRLSRSD